ncbi:sensor histidine kinase [Oenococcus oeni]|uniref:sensor histidine kinase n=1 Tax=Oenococcus oeni TaxID=1247 RepID=UPI003EE42DC9
MSKTKINSKQYIKLFLLEAIGFLMIFSFVGSYIYFTYTRTIQRNADQILNSMVLRIQKSFRSGSKQLMIPGLVGQGQGSTTVGGTPSASSPQEGSLLKSNVSGQDTIYYSKSGKIVNSYSLGLRIWTYENLYKKISGELNNIQTIKLSGSYFRVRLIKLKKPIFLIYGANTILGTAKYAAVVYNFDTERSNMDSFRSVLFWTLMFAGMFSLVVSWLVTLRVMRPILQSWKQQQEFVNNAAHELRTPLTIIQNKMEGLLRKPTSSVADVSENIVVSLSEVRRLNQLTSDMLTLARTGSNMTQLDPKMVDIENFIKEVIEPYSEIAASKKRKFAEEIDIKGKMVIDTRRVHQLIVILLDNALKYTEAKDLIKIKARREKNNLVIEVADNGRGISAEAKKHVFDRFYREEKSGNRSTGGTGLGLSIAKWIVNAFQGKISVSDNSPKGTIFKVVLPQLKLNK